MTGVVHVDTHRKTLDLALKLHPGTKEVFIITGTLDHDKKFEKLSREALKGFESKATITYLTDLPIKDLIAKVSSLPEHSIVLYIWQQSENEQGKVLESVDVLSLISQSASAPIYGLSTFNLGHGIVGGYLYIAEARAARVAELTMRIINGERAQDIPVESAPAESMFDWRQLKRWGISEAMLPPGSIVQFKEQTFWERYKWRIIVVLTLVGAETLLISFLLVERDKRRRASENLQKSEEHFRLLFENSRDAILIWDDEGHILQSNKAACELLGSAREKLLQMNVFDLPTADRADTAASYEAYARAGIGDGEFSFVRPDGESRTCLYSACRFAPGRHLSILRDISERNLAVKSLREAFSRSSS